MSHLNTRINNVSPSVDGAFPSLSISGLSDYATTPPTDGQTLKYDDTTATWEASDHASGTPYAVAQFGRGESVNYSSSGLSLSAGSVFGLYDSTPINQMSNYVTFNYGASNWLYSVTLQAGKYELITSIACVFSASGYLRYSWRDSSGVMYSNQGALGEFRGFSSVALGYVDTASPLEIFLTIDVAVNVATATAQANYPSLRSHLSVRKVI